MAGVQQASEQLVVVIALRLLFFFSKNGQLEYEAGEYETCTTLITRHRHALRGRREGNTDECVLAGGRPAVMLRDYSDWYA